MLAGDAGQTVCGYDWGRGRAEMGSREMGAVVDAGVWRDRWESIESYSLLRRLSEVAVRYCLWGRRRRHPSPPLASTHPEP